MWQKPVFVRFSQWAKIFGCGMCMGAADIVPGISGGTVAFIIGIYEDLLNSIKTFNIDALKLLFRGKFSAFFQQISWQFLLALVLGVTASFITLAKFFTYLLSHEVYRSYLYSGFLGLVLGSVVFCTRQLSVWRLRYLFPFVFCAIIAYQLSGTDLIPKSNEALYDIPFRQEVLTNQARGKFEEHAALNFDQATNRITGIPKSALLGMVSKKYLSKSDLIYSHEANTEVAVGDVIGSATAKLIDPWVVVCGMIAISAMLLPGISGSYLLTVLGMYGPILGALVDLIDGLGHLMFDVGAFRTVFSMLIGIAIGATLFSRVVLFLLSRFPNATLAALIGFMVGALRAVWPFWSYQYQFMPLRLSDGPALEGIEPILPNFASAEFFTALVCMVLGFGYVLFIEAIASKKLRDHTEITPVL